MSNHRPLTDIFTGSRTRLWDKDHDSRNPERSPDFLSTCLPINLDCQRMFERFKKNYIIVHCSHDRILYAGGADLVKEKQNKRQLFWLSITQRGKKWAVNHFITFTLNWISPGPEAAATRSWVCFSFCPDGWDWDDRLYRGYHDSLLFMPYSQTEKREREEASKNSSI